ALPRVAPPTTSSARDVVSVNSSMFARVPGPADRDEIDDTISAYITGATLETAATIGTVAWPPHVTMFTFGEFRCSSPLTTGTTYGPIAAGVKSTTRLPAAWSTSLCTAWAPALVASNTNSMSANSGI